ncbi:alpha/beta hydrolase fold domain-containing protein [Marivirga sp. S37H4]|uniref:Alpha/beta hydrolase fold domain-containing protein n=1 Tax=Marivirga aurantiaca TaxID=2802615 RepID=A0A934WVR1_9BACT|nr:alpha/beta hydrolase fold domain-containing protein [Marivirga aurantiaca]MBK6263839.1 alpha/beta hydrolase fold domain-containing protein [Marivirga aurantiaca]
MIKKTIFLIMLLGSQLMWAQNNSSHSDSSDKYFSELKVIANSVSHYIYNDFPAFNSQTPAGFINQIDSLEQIFVKHLNNYSQYLSQQTIKDEEAGIKYFFDMLLLEYPMQHEIYTGKKIHLSKGKQQELANNLQDFNKIPLLENRDFKAYVKSYLTKEVEKELLKGQHGYTDNIYLHLTWEKIHEFFTVPEIKDFWMFEYLNSHIANIGVKNIESIYNDFLNICQSEEFKQQITKAYEQSINGRNQHLIESYKTINGLNLEMHLFLPDSNLFNSSRPTIVYFHGGSWSEGKPDWFFEAGEYYAKKGYVAAAVEYRIKARHNTLPFEAVKDAKSSIRWLREHADKFNIDANKIIVTGNSAGGHLALCTALVENWNEESDDIKYSSMPNIVMVNSGAYDLTIENSKWITLNSDDKDIVKEISPNYLLKSNMPNMLLIHGEKDSNTPYETAVYFRDKMKALGNNIEFHTIEEAGHFIWFGQHATDVSEIRSNYLENLNWN